MVQCIECIDLIAESMILFFVSAGRYLFFVYDFECVGLIFVFYQFDLAEGFLFIDYFHENGVFESYFSALGYFYEGDVSQTHY